MNYEDYFKGLLESIPDYRRIVLLILLIQNDRGLLRDIGVSERDINRLILEMKYILKEQHQEYLDYVKNEEYSVVGKFLNK